MLLFPHCRNHTNLNKLDIIALVKIDKCLHAFSVLKAKIFFFHFKQRCLKGKGKTIVLYINLRKIHFNNFKKYERKHELQNSRSSYCNSFTDFVFLYVDILADNCNVTETACSLYLDKNISFEGVRLQMTNNMFVRCF